jgi:VanZ family protein
MSDIETTAYAGTKTSRRETSRLTPKQRLIRVNAPLVIWLLLMITGSSLPGDTLPDIPVWNVDKLAHTAEYLVLALLTFRYLRLGRVLAFTRSWHITGIVLIIYAALDELHQLFIPNRSCDWHDFAADCSGIILGIWLAMRIYRRARR